MPGCCYQMETLPGGTQQIKLCLNHLYYAQIQGQMAVGDRAWCDFVMYTTKGINVKFIYFDTNYWSNTLLPYMLRLCMGIPNACKGLATSGPKQLF